MSRAPSIVVALVLALPGGLEAQDRFYVTNQDAATVSVLSLETFEVIETIDLREYGFGDNAKPHHVQVEPDGSYWYLTLIGAGKVLKLNRDNEIVGQIDTDVPGLMALLPGAGALFVGRSMSAVNPPSRMLLVERAPFTVADEIDLLFPRPHALAFDPQSDRVYVASLGVNQFASVGPGPDVRLVDVPPPHRGLAHGAVSPDGRWLALTGDLTDEILIYDVSDPANPRYAVSLAMPDGPFGPEFTPDGRFLYVTVLRANVVARVAVGSWGPAELIEHEAFVQPHGIAMSPDGQYVLVSSRHQHGDMHDHEGGNPTGNGTLTVLCAATGEVLAVAEVGEYATGVGAPAPSRPLPLPPSEPCR